MVRGEDGGSGIRHVLQPEDVGPRKQSHARAQNHPGELVLHPNLPCAGPPAWPVTRLLPCSARLAPPSAVWCATGALAMRTTSVMASGSATGSAAAATLTPESSASQPSTTASHTPNKAGRMTRSRPLPVTKLCA